MRKLLVMSICGAALLAFGGGHASAKPKGASGYYDPPRMSDRGLHYRSADHWRGANKRGFCPPGQAKKPGRGSAFNC